MDLIKEIHKYLTEDIKKMNMVILSSLAVEEELVKVISSYLASSGGKRIRPILTILSAKIFNYKGKSNIKLAAAVEFIHMATLLHDDVVDGSKMRRFLPSANVVWGSKASILVGDFLFSQSFKLIVATKSILALTVLSDASAIIASGEVAQLAKLEEKRFITEEEYLKIINAKTAELFGSACEVGAIVSNQSSIYRIALRNFGMNLGIIFQIVDDILDYFSNSEKVGKNVGEDFREGKVTLPLIFLNDKLSKEKKDKLKSLIKANERSSEDFTWVKGLLVQFDIKTDILNYLKSLKKTAIESLEQISVENQCKEYLKGLVDFAISRSY